MYLELIIGVLLLLDTIATALLESSVQLLKRLLTEYVLVLCLHLHL